MLIDECLPLMWNSFVLYEERVCGELSMENSVADTRGCRGFIRYHGAMRKAPHTV